ncbi:hypothetical protein PMAYCL1PPCAC_11735 [Pristionchus mayeri]|uniref:Cytochrome P450 n=1 Tax=Pristionchus mayeri TaxID=1317129 RepID=A0AAN5CDS0_9BILA|nr:hypothetical protein PMAYCL1PPCAC_11735 [Pristionchus mayeri]
MITLLFFLVSALTAIYAFYVRSSTYWLRRGVVAVPPKSIVFGSTKELLQKDYPRVLKYRDWGRKYGKTYGIKEGVHNMLVTSDLEMVQEIFVKQFDYFHSRKHVVFGPDLEKDERVNLFESRGARWKRLRTLSAPSFSVSSLKKIRPVVEDSVLNMVRIMEERHAGGDVFNIHQFYCEYTMDTIGRLVMGQKESLIFNNPRVAVAQSLFLRNFDQPMVHLNLAIPLINPITKWAMRKFGSKLTEDSENLKAEMEVAVYNRIKQRESNEEKSSATADFIDLFLDFAAEMAIAEKKEFKMSDAQVSKILTVDEVVAQAVIFLLAGFDTTANALGYTSWMLANHPEVMRRCQEEIDEFCCDESISYEDLSNLTYIEAVCKETLRFYPLGAFANSRQCMKETEVCGLIVEKGTNVQVDTYGLHFDRSIWGEDADEFKPERWLDADRRVPSHAYIPFGVGPRICIGMRLAMMEEKLALAHILRKFDIVKETTVTELKLQGSLTITPVEVPVKIMKRK